MPCKEDEIVFCILIEAEYHIQQAQVRQQHHSVLVFPEVLENLGLLYHPVIHQFQDRLHHPVYNTKQIFLMTSLE